MPTELELNTLRVSRTHVYSASLTHHLNCCRCFFFDSVLLKMSVALHLGKDQLPIPIESLDPFFDADYVSDGSDIDIDIEEMDAEDFDSEDCSDEDEDYDDDEREHGDDEDEDDRDIDDCDYVDDDDDQPNTEEQTERLTSEKEKKKENKYENRNESNNENDNEKKALSPDQKSALMSSEKSIMKPCMWPNYPLLLKVSKCWAVIFDDVALLHHVIS